MDRQDDTPMEPGPRKDEPIVLLEGWMILAILFPEAMGEVARVPPANDRD